MAKTKQAAKKSGPKKNSTAGKKAAKKPAKVSAKSAAATKRASAPKGKPATKGKKPTPVVVAKTKGKARPVVAKAKPKRKPMTRNQTAATAGAIAAGALAVGAAALAKGTGKKRSRTETVPLEYWPREVRADEELVARTLELLAGRDRRSVAELREVGAHLIDAFFGGDADMARANHPKLQRSWTFLAERADESSDWDGADLLRAVTGEVVARSLPEDVVARLEPTNLERLGRIDDAATRADIAGRIASGEVRGKALRQLIAQHAGNGSTGRPGPVRLAGNLERALSRAEAEGALEHEEIADVKPEDRTGLLARLESVASRLTGLLDRLRS